MLYTLGKVLDAEYSLRSLATAKEDGKFAQAMAKRVHNAQGAFQEIVGLAPLPEMTAILGALETLKLKPNNESQLNAAADQIRDAAQELANNHDGSQLGALDKVIPTPDTYKGKTGEGAPKS